MKTVSVFLHSYRAVSIIRVREEYCLSEMAKLVPLLKEGTHVSMAAYDGYNVVPTGSFDYMVTGKERYKS